MFNKMPRRALSIANWLLLSLNVLLLVALLIALRWLLPMELLTLRAMKDARLIGMELYFARSPFSLFVPKEFPQNRGFTLFDYEQGLFVSAEPTDKEYTEADTELSMSLGEDFSMSCRYSYANGVHTIYELGLSRQNEWFTDLNADGIYDLRQIRDHQRHVSHMYLLYRGEWQEVSGDKQERYLKPLKNGETVSFDRKRGSWVALDMR